MAGLVQVPVVMVMAVALVMGAEDARAQGLPGVKIAALTCVHLVGDMAVPLKGARYEDGVITCAIRITASVPSQRIGMSLSLLQDDPESGVKQVARARGTADLVVWKGFSHDSWLWVQLDPAVNGCMPFTVTAEVAGHQKSVTAAPFCPD
jgi:hypothetical protein